MFAAIHAVCKIIIGRIAVADDAGVLSDLGVLITPDGLSHATVFYRMLSTLYLASGLQ